MLPARCVGGVPAAPTRRFLQSKGALLPARCVGGVPAALFFALLAPSASCLLHLVGSSYDIQTRGEHGRTLLQLLACTERRRHFEETALQLLSKGVSIDAKDDTGSGGGSE